MNRRSFAFGAAGVAVGSLLDPKWSQAQDATPASTPDRVYLRDTTDLPSLRRIVYRGFDANNPYVFPEGASWVYCYGMAFPTADDAQNSMQAFAQGLWKYAGLTIRNGWDVGHLYPTSMRDLGDASAAWTWNDTSSESDHEWRVVLTTVAQDRWMQALWASSEYGNPVSALADFAEQTLKRWPNTSKMTEKNGVHSGGLWDSMPTLSDMPEGVSLVYESEEEGPFTPRS